MARRSLEVPIPPDVDPTDYADAIHARLTQAPGVHHVTVDVRNRRVLVEVEEPEFSEARIGALMAEEIGRARPRRETAAPPAFEGDMTPVPGDRMTELRKAARTNKKRLLFVLAAGFVVMLAEVAGGVWANSLVLLADAGHYLADLIAVFLAYLAVTWTLKGPTGRRTFGYERAEVVAAFVQAIGLWILGGYLVWEAVQRLQDPPEVEGAIVALVGGGSLVVNAGLAWVLHRGTGHNLNLRAAYLHILTDVLGSAAALAAGLLIFFFGLHIMDPVLTFVVAILIFLFALRLTRQSMHILLEGTPQHVDPEAVEESLRSVPEVQDVHDLHLWTLTSGVDSLSAHVVLAEPPKDDHVAHQIHERIRDRFRIDHITIQVEDPGCPCDTMRHQWGTA